ncbi:MAG: hypothetical protein JWN98_2343 [Abditibacteriota bacterium]|nr:hypothetical protein [Abditibacteriota bacterium]
MAVFRAPLFLWGFNSVKPNDVNVSQLSLLFDELNLKYFDNSLPACRIEWSRRLTRAAGNIDVRRRLVKLSTPLLIDAFASDSLFPPEFSVCGVPCDNPQRALEEILKHEMIHLWLHELGLPSGHTPEFRAKARAIGQPRTRHGIALPIPKSGWIYACPACHTEFSRRRRYGRAVACAKCCKQWNKGRYDERFKLRGRRIS